MPRISTFMYCEATGEEALPDGQKRLHVVQPMQILNPVFIPGTLNFSIVFGLLGIETEKSHQLQFLFRKKGSEEAAILNTNTINLQPMFDPAELELPAEQRGLIGNLSFQNVIFRSEGNYESEIIFDGESLGIFPIYVMAKERL